MFLDISYVTVFTFFGLILLLLWKATRRPTGIPPGPAVWFPFLGHIPLMMRKKDLRILYKDLRDQYGDVSSMYVGNSLWIVLNGYDTIRDAFVKRGNVFSDRPSMFISEHITGQQGILMSSGKVWKEHRTFAIGALKDLGVGRRGLESRILPEVAVFLDGISETNGQDFDVRSMIQASTCNVICSILFGRRFDYTDHNFQLLIENIDVTFKNVNLSSLLALFPLLRYLPGDLFKYQQMMANKERYRKLIHEIIEDHKSKPDIEETSDYVHAFLKEMKLHAGDPDTIFTDKQLGTVVADFFVAGTESTATMIRWSLIYLLQYPDIQARLRTEIHEVVGRNRLPVMDDLPKLPFTEAFMNEVQRHADVSPFAVHSVPYDVEFRGFTIPKGTAVIANLESVMRDPAVWQDPHLFCPTRFLDEDGKVVKPEEFTPFGVGPRICIGSALARAELFLYLSSMVQSFRFLPPEGQDPPPIEGFIAIVHMPKPFRFRALKLT